MKVRKCKECGKKVPRGKSIISFACQVLGYCRYCYQAKFPPAKEIRIKKYLNSAQIRENYLRIHKEIARELYEPAFFKEWLELWEGGE